MTKTFAVDSNNDLYIGEDDRLAIADGLLAVLQNCEHVALSIRNEMVLAQGRGLPYFETVWTGGVRNVPLWEAVFRQQILAVTDVLAVVSLETVLEGETLKYTAVIRTIYGVGTING